MFKKLVILLCLVLTGQASFGEADSIRVTLLTCSPGQEVYELYGHTAILCQKVQGARGEEQEDTSYPHNSHTSCPSPLTPELENPWVFNYGVFDMTKPYFAWHFVLGQTDYMVQPVLWEFFIKEYEARGSSIIEQELNLTQAEAHKLTNRLIENCQPENSEYRYNFLYKNCTTMVRDIVESVINGRIQYPDTLPRQTYREILHRYTAGHPWAQEGNDLLLGSEVDTILSDRAAMFVPENLMRYFDGAFICTPRGDMRPLVKSKRSLIPTPMPKRWDYAAMKASHLGGKSEEDYPTPLQAMLAFGGVCLLVMLLEMWTKWFFWIWDVLLLLLQGTAGILLTFLLLFSGHPGVGSNWQVWILNPIALIGIPFVIKAAIRHRPTLWYGFQFVLLALFLLFSPWIPQVFAKVTIPLTLCLLTRPISYYLVKVKSEE